MLDHIHSVLTAHQLSATNASHKVRVGEEVVEIWGHATCIAECGVPEVVLFTTDSTPQKAKTRPEAEAEFQAAAERLVREGVEFYTFLRPMWALPAIRWTRDFR